MAVRRAGALLGIALTVLLAPGIGAQPNRADPAAVAEVAAGKRDVANAAWWGFDPEDATAALQGAIGSGARKVIVPYMGSPWVLTPVRLRGNQELILEPGVVLLAKKGAFLGPGDSLLTADGVENLTIRGYGAVLRMRKRDYQQPPYPKAEWRMCLALRGVKNVLVEGLRAESSGGDGFYVSGNSVRRWAEDVTLRNCAAEDNHRQGISVISAVNLLIDNCRFASTGGTAPEAGIDIEPDTEEERVSNIVVRNSIFENNRGHNILIHLANLTRRSGPVTIRFENCLARVTEAGAGGHAGIAVGGLRKGGPEGLIEFAGCVTEQTGRDSVRIYDKSAEAAKLRFADCHFHSPWRAPALDFAGPRVPILLLVRRAPQVGSFGNIEFEDCHVYDAVDRPVVQFDSEDPVELEAVRGTLYAVGRQKARARLAGAGRDVTLRVVALPSASGAP